MYETEFADVYDLIYRHRGKDYAAEAAFLAELVNSRRAGAESVLDVASGTGGHLRFLRELFARAEGLEISPDMLDIARRRLPGVTMHRGDMRDFDLGRTFDAVTLMFSSIGYVADKAELDQTLTCLAGHLDPGGVLIIEPWVFPDTFVPGYVAADLARDDGRTVSRVSHSVRDGDAVKMTLHYLCADASGIRHLTDTHRLALFTPEQYEDAFTQAGCRAEFVRTERFSRGLFVGVRK
ncbi:class I SAM-dependent methyltransferase [Micromonospora halophytica]|uniref:Methyltransferase domain-containing protein n=1 Tax=Micromonospora halophytica TaxID=47864 RepID=A0A1C5ILJ4_9ACTN|nr:class I SAM-dependent methyltransferase [Micromonospora halophytica]SCG58646.1 Methyltransferase domain-containing protein [Micromonospora halophytica]